ncbi:MAG: hypothetical protein GF311_14760 [Candidatus Lokiarchaeota archaeon]|nr:hypothetical protein [Candidatus Lokiarchaeota archaeon]
MASNVYIERTHIEKFFQRDLDRFSISSEELNFHEQKFNFISELLSFLYSQISKNIIQDIENLINILVDIPNKKFEKNIFSEFNSSLAKVGDFEVTFTLDKQAIYSVEDYLRMLNKVRELTTSCSELSLHEKAELCKLERCFMKNYLKEVNQKLS